ncbi:Translation initiation factor IF-2, mitochondrial [Chionoecetes opilio]|uniref:Translation initiation factor IF-2, mitochondrial n=1 Tax=Chionoecetes opilio TaxID=41210 RepID=A0A8J5CQ11_CHIOP|nr:Translation initiation factor IF-2, mitochondrial [Chionoecetes opilio]
MSLSSRSQSRLSQFRARLLLHLLRLSQGEFESGERATFLDTPGHAAFGAMRARGAMVTDVVVLVVAADDGVMAQTRSPSAWLRKLVGGRWSVSSLIASVCRQAVSQLIPRKWLSSHYIGKTACLRPLANQRRDVAHPVLPCMLPVVVAINKVDKPGADVGRTRRMLLNAGLQLEEQGGEVQAVEVSALTGLNLGRLVEAVVTQAEMLNLRADSTGTVEGVVVESMTDPGRGKVATCVIQRGTLSHGAVLVAGTAWGKVRGMFNDAGKPIKSAPPATPVQVIGWRHLPSAGDVVLEVEGEHRAVEVVEWRETFSKRQQQAVDEIAIQEKLQEHLKHYRAQRDEKRKMGISRCTLGSNISSSHKVEAVLSTIIIVPLFPAQSRRYTGECRRGCFRYVAANNTPHFCNPVFNCYSRMTFGSGVL